MAGHKVTRVPEGAGLGITARGWYKAARDVEVSRIVSENDLIDQRIDLAQTVNNGLGETIYIGE